MTLQEIETMIVNAERQAGELIMHAHGIMPENKTDARNVVTEYDRRVQDLLIGIFRDCLPSAHFFCEENDLQDSLATEHAFIIDPIDGTANFVHGFHHSCVSVAYARFGKVCAAAIYNPYMDEMFTAVEGCGACLNGKTIRVNGESLSGSIACIGTSPYYMETADETFRVMRYMYEHALDIRREGSAALDLVAVASGRAGIYLEEKLSYWDYAAGALIVTEAGGTVFTVTGETVPSDGSKSSVLAGSPPAVEDFLRDYAGITRK